MYQKIICDLRGAENGRPENGGLENQDQVAGMKIAGLEVQDRIAR